MRKINTDGSFRCSRAVELTHGTSTSQGVLLVDIRYSSLEQLFGGITTGRGGYFYMISGNGEILYHPQMRFWIPAGCGEQWTGSRLFGQEI